MLNEYEKEYLNTYSINDGWGDVGVGWSCPYCDENHNWEYTEKGEEYTCEGCGKISVAEFDCDF